MVENKPILKISEMVDYLKAKNIKFEKYLEHDAYIYLRNNNNYYNVISYKNNFIKYQCGNFEGKYIDLDFAYLVDLSDIDYQLRILLFKMVINIEHYLKVRILNIIDNIDEEDGYNIVSLYMKKDKSNVDNPNKLKDSILRKISNEYYKKIFVKYDLDNDNALENITIWEFLEIITFVELINFFEFFSTIYNLKEKRYIFILREVNKLRNAVAHNCCILSELDKKDNLHSADILIIKYLKKCKIGKENRTNKLMNSRIRQITYTLFLFNEFVFSDSIKNDVCCEINKLFYKRINLNKVYYNNNGLLNSIYEYFEKIIAANYEIKI